MTAKTITELQGKRLRVTVLPEQGPEADDWIMQYALKMKNRTPEEIEAARARNRSSDQTEYVLPPGKTALDVYEENRRQIAAEEPETEQEARALDEAIKELS